MSLLEWYNYKTQAYDSREAKAPMTDEEAILYIPQNPPAQNLYALYREQGLPIFEAMRKVLEVSVNGPDRPTDGYTYIPIQSQDRKKPRQTYIPLTGRACMM